ncbi:MAG: hypothetical protein Q8933_13465 [Bacteroidota bacterium]|nr:hypothetical protein [Bacteroidota bacterium]MDP4190280.1 hypothetical protein [Bacteroidota bacterium]MDP4194281.1 hypothetical protein [Bacteroidota bacterium]
MKITEIKATGIQLETEKEVEMVAYIISELMGWDYVDDPDSIAFQALELQDFLSSQSDFVMEFEGEKVSYKEEFEELKKTVMNMSEDEAIQFRLTEKMKEKIDEILPAFDDDDEDNS